MDDGPTPAVLRDIFITRYVNAAAFVILLYDHLLTLGTEISLIWPAKLTSAKALFLYVRYVVPCAMILYTVQLSGLASSLTLSDAVSSVLVIISSRSNHYQFCRWWMSFAAFIGWAAVASSNCAQRSSVSRTTLTATSFNFASALGYMGPQSQADDLDHDMLYYHPDNRPDCSLHLGLANEAFVSLPPFSHQAHIVYPAHLQWNKGAQMCIFNRHVQVSILWIPGMVFDIILFLVTWWNALNKPRPSNAPLAATMYRDGLFYFVVLLALRILNTVLAEAPHIQNGLTFVAMFPVLCLTATTTCRLIIRLREVSDDEQLSYDAPDEMLTVNGDYDELEHSGVQIDMLRSSSVGPSTPMRATGRWY
ncbi:hypothetical protein MIND_00084100 [Mycena indigotica]|uniref:DUF6533 domain-containing protein n=1 Tax=Mycena indigotica TaxID=2126181 RepID=A0A8H6TH68_9AGAR|nr:uncharacterized protein MIND_00084100 [Mycena indigotica]KAF7315685.1 hypothetical protein MIND_00084100 [Mycena indigotica]